MSNELVLDASAATKALVGKDADSRALRSRLMAVECHAPHLVDAEVGQALRGGVLRGEIGDEEAITGLAGLARMVEFRYPHEKAMRNRAWDLRHSISFYDGLYVALATMLDVPLLSRDAKLARASGLTCQVELVT